MCITNFSRRPSKLIALNLSAITTTECVSEKDSAVFSKPPQQKPLTSSEPDGKERPKLFNKRLQPGLTTKNHQRRFIEHNYRDHSGDKPLGEEEEMIQKTLHVVENNGSFAVNVDSEALNSVKRDPRGGVPVPFPLKLHELLDTIEADGHADVLSWQPHGRSFRVHKTKEFVEMVMPQYFRQSKLTSFQRQLNLYGFQRITKGRDRGGYYHELFLRGKLFLANRIERNKVKGTKIKGVTSPETEPDFYSMPFVIVSATSSEKDVSSPPTTNSCEDVPMPSRAMSSMMAVSEPALFSPVKVSAPSERSIPVVTSACDDASFEGMLFHLVSPSQQISGCALVPSSPLPMEISAYPSDYDDESSLEDWVSDVILREDDESFDNKFDALSTRLPALSFVSDESSPSDDDDCSFSSMKDATKPMATHSSYLYTLGGKANFEGMPFHLIVPNQPMPFYTSPLKKSCVVRMTSLSSDSEESSDNYSAYDCSSADFFVPAVETSSFNEWFGALREDEEMCLLNGDVVSLA